MLVVAGIGLFQGSAFHHIADLRRSPGDNTATKKEARRVELFQRIEIPFDTHCAKLCTMSFFSCVNSVVWSWSKNRVNKLTG